MSLYVSFAPSMDDTLRTSHPRKVRIALRNHKTLFYQGGLTLNVFSSILLTPTALFHLELLTLLTLHQGDSVPTPTVSNVVSNVIADIPPEGHAPLHSKPLCHTPIDPADNHSPLPRLTPLIHAEGILSCISSGNVRSIRHNTTLSFCPGVIIYGTPQPYVVGAGEVTSPLCSSLALFVACPKVFHIALHTGSNFSRDFGLHTFLKSVLQ